LCGTILSILSTKIKNYATKARKHETAQNLFVDTHFLTPYHNIVRAEIIQDYAPCNQDCIFCNAPPDIPPGLPTEKTRETILQLLNDGVEKIILSGGEPTLRKDLVDIIRFARENGAKIVEIYTNAIRLDSPKYTRSLVEAGLNGAFISLHHHDEIISDLLTRTPGTYSRTIKGIHTLHRCGVPITINIVVNSGNYRDLKAYTQFVIRRFPYIDAISFSFVMCGARAQKNPAMVPRMSKASPYLKEAYEICLKKKMNFANPGCGVPICFVPEYYEYCFEYQMLKSQSSSLRLSMQRNETEKMKLPMCTECVFNEYCLGVWRGYLNVFGSDEIVPVRDGVKLR